MFYYIHNYEDEKMLISVFSLLLLQQQLKLLKMDYYKKEVN